MASRMERYYRSNAPKKRSQLNQDLYRGIYEDGEYSNIEGVAMIDKNNEIDITKVKKMLKNREDYKRQKEYRNLITRKEEPKTEMSMEFTNDEEEKSYDIMDVLKEAKESNDEDNRYLSLDNTNYNILKELKIEKETKKEDSTEELKELINTITNTSMLNKLDDKALSLKLLEDLQGETKAIDNTNYKTNLNNTNTTTKLDKSFFTSSMKFSHDDFDDGVAREKGKAFKIIMFVILLLMTAALIFFVITKLK